MSTHNVVDLTTVDTLWTQRMLPQQKVLCLPAADPIHLPHLIGPMKHYLWILKTTHGGADMDTCLEMAKGGLDGGSLPVAA